MIRGKQFAAILLRLQRSHWIGGGLRRRMLNAAGCQIHPTAFVHHSVGISEPRLTMHAGSYINVGARLDCAAAIIIEEGAGIAMECLVLTKSHPIAAGVMRRARTSDIVAPVTIRRGCWIGVRSVLLPGVEIAEGTVIAAGSVVTVSTSPNTLYAGIPAVKKKDLPL